MKSKGRSSHSPERRRAPRRPVLETFSCFVVIPEKGLHRLKIYDLSENGIGFDLDEEDESQDNFPARMGDVIPIRFYLNQSLYISLEVKLARVVNSGALRRAGGEFVEKEGSDYQAFRAFLNLLDRILENLQIDPGK